MESGGGRGYHTVAIHLSGKKYNENTVWTWGRNNDGQVSNRPGSESKPGRINGVMYRTVIAGEAHTLAIGYVWNSSTLNVWGANDEGQLGLGDKNNRKIYTQVGYDNWKTAAAGYKHTVGIKKNETLWAWGYNEYGQIGLGDTTNRNTPRLLVD